MLNQPRYKNSRGIAFVCGPCRCSSFRMRASQLWSCVNYQALPHYLPCGTRYMLSFTPACRFNSQHSIMAVWEPTDTVGPSHLPFCFWVAGLELHRCHPESLQTTASFAASPDEAASRAAAGGFPYVDSEALARTFYLRVPSDTIAVMRPPWSN